MERWGCSTHRLTPAAESVNMEGESISAPVPEVVGRHTTGGNDDLGKFGVSGKNACIKAEQRRVRGHPFMTSAKFSDFLTPSPPLSAFRSDL